ncbi:MAG TPA: hypothetical protein VK558_03965 [Patescibacteria group bacterium]|nr:hypothetical protein [Patescibacteria group bacterium]
MSQPDHHHTAATGPAEFRPRPAADIVKAHLRATAKGLEIRDPKDGLLLALWAYDDLCPVEAAPSAKPAKVLHLTCRADPDACLTIAAPAMVARLHLALSVPRRLRLVPLALALGVMLLGLLAGLPAR